MFRYPEIFEGINNRAWLKRMIQLKLKVVKIISPAIKDIQIWKLKVLKLFP